MNPKLGTGVKGTYYFLFFVMSLSIGWNNGEKN
jgi:hypothetical protein